MNKPTITTLRDDKVLITLPNGREVTLIIKESKITVEADETMLLLPVASNCVHLLLGCR